MKTTPSPSQKGRPKSTSVSNVHHVPIPDGADDEVSTKRNLELLKKEMEKKKYSVETTKALLHRTFSYRWDRFVNLNQPPSLQEYLCQYPMLKKATYVSVHTRLQWCICCACRFLMSVLLLQAAQEFGDLLKQPNIRDHFEDQYPLWAKAIVNYSRKTQVKSAALQKETEEYNDDDDDPGTCTCVTDVYSEC